VLLASQPTRGLDVGSIEFVHKRIISERDKGLAVVIISAELDEIYALADRIAVMYEGRITGIRPPSVPVEELGLLMAGASGPGDTVPADMSLTGTGAAPGVPGPETRDPGETEAGGAGAPEPDAAGGDE